jgi:hypothetical protein
MIVCPVCEHPQAQGEHCESCGKRLVAGPTAADLALPRVEGLEPTAHAPAAGGTERLAELQPTGHEESGTPVPDAMPDFEATAAAPVDVDVEPTADVEPTSAGIPGDLPTTLAGTLACRYCRTPATPGELLCTRCGMRLPLPIQASPEAPPAPRICSCGATVRGRACPSCGARAE